MTVMSSPSKRIKRTENNYADISCINESKRISGKYFHNIKLTMAYIMLIVSYFDMYN